MLSIRLFSTLVVALATLTLGLITLLNNYQRRTNLTFFAVCFFTGFYTVANYLADFDVQRALFWVRLTFTLAALILYAMVMLANRFPRQILNRLAELIFSFGTLIILVITFLPSLVPSIIRSEGVSSVVPGSLYVVFIVYVALGIFGTAGLLVASMRRSQGPEKMRARYVFTGLVITAALISVTNLFIPLATKSNAASIYGVYPILIFLSASTIAIIRHRLFDVRLVVARSLAYLLLLGTLGGFYGLAVFGASNFLFHSTQASSAQNWLYIGLAIVLAFTFQPLRRFFEHLTDRIFYRDHYDSEEVLYAITKILASELDLGLLLDKTLRGLCQGLHIEWGQFFVVEHDEVFKVGHYGRLPKKMVTIPELKNLNQSMLIADELEDGARKQIMGDHNLRISLALSTKEQFVGFLLLGDKLSGDIYTTQDIDLLEILAGELAVAVQNAKAYEEIARFNETLKQKIKEATVNLRQANEQLKALDAAKDEFISMASHQLRTPLTTIKGYASMLAEGDAGPLNPQQKQFLNEAFTSADKMVGLITDLLNVSRMTSGKFVIDPKLFDLADMVKQEVELQQPQAQAKHLQLVFTPPPSPVQVELDEDKTRQVVMNFIDNAVHYTNNGSVKVSLATSGDKVIYKVTDTGIGVPPAARSQLFSKFYRAENAKNARPDGTGLGLYLAKRVIQDQGGTIIFDSTVGKGSTFGFELPVKVLKGVSSK